MTYIKLQNYINMMVVGEHGIQTFEVVVVVLLLLLLLCDDFVPTSAHPLLFLNKWLLNDQGIFFLDEIIEKSMDYNPKSFGGNKPLV